MSPVGGPTSVRGIRNAVGEAVGAAGAGDAERFEAAVGVLGAQDQQRLSIVQGAIVRELLENLHPDGLSGEDAQQVLTRCVSAAIGWYPGIDAEAMIIVLMGALGAGDPDEAPPVSRAAVLAHGALLIADLLSAQPDPAGSAPTGRLARQLDRAFAEIERAETIELP